MKRMITSLLVVVLMFGALGLAVCADTYSDTFNVADTFFTSYYFIRIPDTAFVSDMRAVGSYTPGVAFQYAASAYTDVDLDTIQEEHAEAYVMLCGDGFVSDGTLTTYEIRDDWQEAYNMDTSNLSYTARASVHCLYSTYAVKIFHSGHICDTTGRDDNYEATYVCPRYSQLYGNE